MRCLILLVALTCIGCNVKNSQKEKLYGEWLEYKSESYDVQKWMRPYTGPKYHIKLLPDGTVEDLTHFPTIERFEYRLDGKELVIDQVRYKIHTLTATQLIVFAYKGPLDIVNSNPYSNKFYLKKIN